MKGNVGGAGSSKVGFEGAKSREMFASRTSFYCAARGARTCGLLDHVNEGSKWPSKIMVAMVQDARTALFVPPPVFSPFLSI